MLCIVFIKVGFYFLLIYQSRVSYLNIGCLYQMICFYSKFQFGFKFELWLQLKLSFLYSVIIVFAVKIIVFIGSCANFRKFELYCSLQFWLFQISSSIMFRFLLNNSLKLFTKITIASSLPSSSLSILYYTNFLLVEIQLDYDWSGGSCSLK